jgi:NitT/TauT family transport system permease protein
VTPALSIMKTLSRAGGSRAPLAQWAVRVVSLLALVLFWWALAWAKADPRVLPGPDIVLPRLLAEAASGTLWQHLSITLWRVAQAFVWAMGLGVVLGVALGLSPTLNRWLDAWLVVFLNLPALVVIVLCFLWIGLNETAAIVAVAINKIPLVAVMMREGARALDGPLADMARVFGMRPMARLRHIILPQLAPHLAATARSGLSLIWKIVLVVEFLGRGQGVGFRIHLHFQMFDVTMVMVYAFSFIAVMLLIEMLILQPAERYAARWRAS